MLGSVAAKAGLSEEADSERMRCKKLNRLKESENKARRASKIWQRLRAKVNAYHDVMKHRLVSNLELVAIGKIGTKSIVRNHTRADHAQGDHTVSDKTMNRLHLWAHYHFQ